MSWPEDPFASPDPAIYEARLKVEKAQAEAAAVAAANAVVKGTSHEVLAWVGDDKDRAKRALDVENATNKPRKGLVEELQEILEK